MKVRFETHIQPKCDHKVYKEKVSIQKYCAAHSNKKVFYLNHYLANPHSFFSIFRAHYIFKDFEIVGRWQKGIRDLEE
jgi:hypothetical protein